MDQKFTKYEYVCTYCDSAITFVTQITQDTMLCPVCFNGYATLLSVADATINNNNLEKEEAPMLHATPEFLARQVETLQAQLKNHQNCDYWKSENGRIQSQIIATLNDAIEDTYKSRNEIITEIADIIDHPLTKEIEFTATMRFTGTIQVPALEADEFDLSGVLDEAYVDINNGDVCIDNYELYDAEEC